MKRHFNLVINYDLYNYVGILTTCTICKNFAVNTSHFILKIEKHSFQLKWLWILTRPVLFLCIILKSLMS